MSRSASYHLGVMVSEGVKRIFYRLPCQQALLQDRLPAVLDAWSCLLYTFNSLKDGIDEDEYKIGPLLEAVLLVIRCSHREEGDRPATDDVRAARKLIVAASSGEAGDPHDFCKAIGVYPAGKTFMRLAHSHASAGIEDEMGYNIWKTASGAFEDAFDGVFHDHVAWMGEGNKGQRQNIKSMTDCLAAIDGYMTSAMSAVGKWSTSALHSKAIEVASSIAVVMQLLRMCSAVAAQCVHERVCEAVLARPFIRCQTQPGDAMLCDVAVPAIADAACVEDYDNALGRSTGQLEVAITSLPSATHEAESGSDGDPSHANHPWASDPPQAAAGTEAFTDSSMASTQEAADDQHAVLTPDALFQSIAGSSDAQDAVHRVRDTSATILSELTELFERLQDTSRRLRKCAGRCCGSCWRGLRRIG